MSQITSLVGFVYRNVFYSCLPPRHEIEIKFRHDENVLDAFSRVYGNDGNNRGNNSGYDSYHESNGAPSPIQNNTRDAQPQWRLKENSKERIVANQNAHLCREKIIKNLHKVKMDSSIFYQTFATAVSTFMVRKCLLRPKLDQK